NMILTSAILVILFWGGWYPLPLLSFLDFIPGPIWLAGKIFVVLSMFIVVRATIPRYRYDQLMNIGWKLFLPISLTYFIITSFLVFYKVVN
ncbi:MAG: NADH-quinone oxidoreductase subunit H, partial [Anaplasmataceae bacterium]|nr:NADH-quinone oxidoreductase subunit H [Anaplasmataceae bacterium]